MKSLKVIILSVMVLALAFSVTNCSTKCCSPCLEVSLCKGLWQGCRTPIQVLTWEPIFWFPQSPNIAGNWGNLQVMRPYLFKVWVTNESNVAVHGVQVVFYWKSWGFSDTDSGTPIGSVAVDLAPNQSKWVRSPWSFVLNPTDICVTVRIFHPCDTILENNFCWGNFHRHEIKYPFENVEIVPFKVDFNELEGQLDYKFEAPAGIDVKIVDRDLPEVETMNVAAFKEQKGVTNMSIKPGFVKRCALLIRNVGANFKPGDKFDVTVKAFLKDKLISSITVNAEINQ